MLRRYNRIADRDPDILRRDTEFVCGHKCDRSAESLTHLMTTDTHIGCAVGLEADHGDRDRREARISARGHAPTDQRSVRLLHGGGRRRTARPAETRGP